MGATSGKSILRIAVVVLFGSAFMWRCANIGSPTGGDKDTLPPVVIAATPDFGTVDFSGKRIYIAFNEYPQLKDQQKEFFTSPRMKRNPTITVRGRGIQIDIRDTLLENTTYTLNFGSSVADNNEGNPLHGFSYVFSTGPAVDSMLMSGYVVDAYTKDSIPKAMVFFFDAAADSLELDSTLYKSTPLAIARAESNGLFLARHLKPMDYRVYVFEDTNDNFTYDAGTDKIAFLDGTFNPADMEDFDVVYDTLGLFFVPEPQLYFRAFEDITFQRQVMSSATRPEQHRINLTFNAPYPQIDTLILEGIDSTRVITEYVTPGRDTINLWLNVPSDQLPDTIRGRISYMRHDSINNLVSYSDKLNLAWRFIETNDQKREREKEEKARQRALDAGEEYTEPEKPNHFSYEMERSTDFNPEHNLSITLGTPAVAIDSQRVSLVRIGEDERRYRVRYRLWQDTLNIRRWNITAPWNEGQKYVLEIPDGVFTDVAGLRNDTITQEFTVMSADKFGTLIVDVRGKTDSSLYVMTVMDKSGKPVQEKKFVSTGRHTFRFLPAGDYKIHILEDMNGNGRWDTGNVVERRQPERTEMFVSDNGEQTLVMKVNWEVEIVVDMARVFSPVSITDIRERVGRSEEMRKKKLLDEALKRWEAEAKRRGGNR